MTRESAAAIQRRSSGFSGQSSSPITVCRLRVSLPTGLPPHLRGLPEDAPTNGRAFTRPRRPVKSNVGFWAILAATRNGRNWPIALVDRRRFDDRSRPWPEVMRDDESAQAACLPELNKGRSEFGSRVGRALRVGRRVYHSCVYGPALQESHRARGDGDRRIRRLHFLARGYVALLARLALYRRLFRLDHRLHGLSRNIRQAASRAPHERRTTA